MKRHCLTYLFIVLMTTSVSALASQGGTFLPAEQISAASDLPIDGMAAPAPEGEDPPTGMDHTGRQPGRSGIRVALIYVGHGEPAAKEDGDIAITLADGTPFGPHAASLGVPPEYLYTEWAAA